MSKLIVYYSYSGHTKAVAESLAAEEAADILEIKDLKRRGKFRAYTAGIIASARGKSWPIQALEVNPADYDRLVLLAPVWAGNPAPPFNALLEQLPEGKAVDIKLVSGSGESSCKERLEMKIKDKGSALESFEDIKAPR